MTLKLFSFIIVAISLSSCGSYEEEACVGRGVAYFKEIGSYPKLESPPNAGRSAEDVARERCKITASAF